MQKDVKVNDFVIMVSTVNGSGSQSANTILLKSLFRMGVPVSGKNVFPSNIAGLPTWFWIRASHQSFVARRERPHIVVAMNPQTIKEDFESVLPGGYFIFNQEIKGVEALERQDILKIPLPVKKLVDQSTDQIKVKKLLANIIYVGALAYLLNIDLSQLESAVKDQFAGKASVWEINSKAMWSGYEYAKAELSKIDFVFRSETIQEGNKNKIIVDGNTAAALGLIYGGATFCSWYPITPSSSLVENFSRYVEKVRQPKEGASKPYAVIQAEDELSAVCMAVGAGWQGARAFTATSGPGVSLMQEALGFAYYTEIPLVVWDVQRVGPSTGMPTRSAQGDLFSAVFASHGDTKHPVLIPGNIEECFSFGQKAFDLAERLQSPVFVLTDLDLGMNLWTSDVFKYPTGSFDRGKILSKENLDNVLQYERYGNPDGDSIPYRVLPGTQHPRAAYLTRGSGHNKKGAYTEKGDEYKEIVDRLAQKWTLAKTLMPICEESKGKNKIGIIYYGSSGPAVTEALFFLTEKNFFLSSLRINGIPFGDQVNNFINEHERIYVLDLNRDGQMWQLLSLEFLSQSQKLISLRHYDGTPITAESVYQPLYERELGGVYGS